MRVTGIIAAALMAATVAGCASESYYGPSTGYRSGYTPYQAYSPAPRYATTTYYSQPGYYSAPSAYRATTYQYSYAPQPTYSQQRGYDGYWDYQRNYRGIHAAPEL